MTERATAIWVDTQEECGGKGTGTDSLHGSQVRWSNGLQIY